jgi:hypothetical protein
MSALCQKRTLTRLTKRMKGGLLARLPWAGEKNDHGARTRHLLVIQLIAACCGERRCLPLAKAFPRTYARPALRKAFATFAADSKVA